MLMLLLILFSFDSHRHITLGSTPDLSIPFSTTSNDNFSTIPLAPQHHVNLHPSIKLPTHQESLIFPPARVDEAPSEARTQSLSQIIFPPPRTDFLVQSTSKRRPGVGFYASLEILMRLCSPGESDVEEIESITNRWKLTRNTISYMYMSREQNHSPITAIPLPSYLGVPFLWLWFVNWPSAYCLE